MITVKIINLKMTSDEVVFSILKDNGIRVDGIGAKSVGQGVCRYNIDPYDLDNYGFSDDEIESVEDIVSALCDMLTINARNVVDMNTFDLIQQGDLVCGKGEYSADIRIVEGVIKDQGSNNNILLVNSRKDLFYEGYEEIEMFNEEWRLLCKEEFLIE